MAARLLNGSSTACQTAALPHHGSTLALCMLSARPVSGVYLLDASLLGRFPELGHVGRLGLGRRPLPVHVRRIAGLQPHALVARRRQVRQLQKSCNVLKFQVETRDRMHGESRRELTCLINPGTASVTQ